MSWKEALRDCVSSSEELSDFIAMSQAEKEKMDAILQHFPMRVPRYYLDLVDWDDPDDPIRKLCIPDVNAFELDGLLDTSGESSNTKLPGLQHKYRQTALIVSTSTCAMYCRHCFRKRLVGADTHGEASCDVAAQASYVREHPEINNVLISGGDAFMNSNQIIHDYLEAFTALPNIHLIRFGTRTPVVLPMRITEDPELLGMLEEFNHVKPIYIITHFNNPRELTDEARTALFALKGRGLVIRNQTVLLRGVNDSAEVLGDLQDQLSGCGVVPYYVFQCRPVTGVKRQFQVPILEAVDIVEGARALQNGQGKTFRYAMSHKTGKVAIVGKLDDDTVVLKYHQAKDPAMIGKVFTMKMRPDQCWLDD